MSWPDHSVTILVNGIVTIWLSHQHSDLLINQNAYVSKRSNILTCKFSREDRGSHYEQSYHVHKSLASDMLTIATTPG